MRRPTGRIQREGVNRSSERTDPDYYEKKLARIALDLKECPKEWLNTFISGIDPRDWKELKERNLIK